jgi:AcrR family transcriptional regulator
VFERDGFLDARVTDITSVAGASTGSFYSYFSDKLDVFNAVAEAVNAEVHHPPSLHDLATGTDDLAERIARNHRAYLEGYRRNARLMRVIEQVTNVSEDYRRLRTALAQDAMAANADAIRRLQADGRADPSLDPVMAARSLSAMVSRAAYVTFVLEEESSIEELVETLTRLWVNALKMPPA